MKIQVFDTDGNMLKEYDNVISYTSDSITYLVGSATLKTYINIDEGEYLLNPDEIVQEEPLPELVDEMLKILRGEAE